MVVDIDNIISVSELQKSLPKKLRDLKSPLFVSRRSKISAVVVPIEEYKRLDELISLLEHLEINETINNRQKNYSPEKNISWDAIKKEYDL